MRGYAATKKVASAGFAHGVERKGGAEAPPLCVLHAAYCFDGLDVAVGTDAERVAKRHVVEAAAGLVGVDRDTHWNSLACGNGSRELARKGHGVLATLVLTGGGDARRAAVHLARIGNRPSTAFAPLALFHCISS